MMDVFDMEDTRYACMSCEHHVRMGQDGMLACRKDQDMTPDSGDDCPFFEE